MINFEISKLDFFSIFVLYLQYIVSFNFPYFSLFIFGIIVIDLFKILGISPQYFITSELFCSLCFKLKSNIHFFSFNFILFVSHLLLFQKQ